MNIKFLNDKWGFWGFWHWVWNKPKPPIIPVPAPEPQKWSGLGMCLEGVDNITQFNADVDTLLAKGFTKIRVHIPAYLDEVNLPLSKAAVLSAIAKGAQVIWGVGGYELTATSWPDYRVGILAAAQWSQANGVYEFQLGNEEESHNDDTTLTDAQLIANLKSVATEVQAIFTNGNVSYTCAGVAINNWIAAGKGDIDFLAYNLYMGGDGYYDDWYKTLVTNLVNAFGANGTYLTEFGPSWSSLLDYSTDEAVQAAGVTEMINYIKASGIERAFYFCYRDTPWLSGFGAIKDNGIYRLLWNSLLNSGG